jgi:hypothetical protein
MHPLFVKCGGGGGGVSCIPVSEKASFPGFLLRVRDYVREEKRGEEVGHDANDVNAIAAKISSATILKAALMVSSVAYATVHMLPTVVDY